MDASFLFRKLVEMAQEAMRRDALVEALDILNNLQQFKGNFMTECYLRKDLISALMYDRLRTIEDPSYDEGKGKALFGYLLVR